MILEFAAHVEARALLYPFFRLYLAVAVLVGTEVAMTAEAGVGKLLQQLGGEQAQGGALRRGAGVRGVAPGVQPAFVADADAVGVLAAAVGADDLQRAGAQHGAVLAHVVVIAYAAEAAAAVDGFQLVHRELTVRTGGGTVDDKMSDFSHDSFHF